MLRIVSQMADDIASVDIPVENAKQVNNTVADFGDTVGLQSDREIPGGGMGFDNPVEHKLPGALWLGSKIGALHTMLADILYSHRLRAWSNGDRRFLFHVLRTTRSATPTGVQLCAGRFVLDSRWRCNTQS